MKRQHCKLGLFTGAISVMKLERKSSIRVSLDGNISRSLHLWYWPIIFYRLCSNFLTSVSGNSLKRKYNDSFSFNGSLVGCELWSLCWWLNGPHYLYTDYFTVERHCCHVLGCTKLLAVWLQWDPLVHPGCRSGSQGLISTPGSQIGFWMIKQWNTIWMYLKRAPGLELETKDLEFG